MNKNLISLYLGEINVADLGDGFTLTVTNKISNTYWEFSFANKDGEIMRTYDSPKRIIAYFEHREYGDKPPPKNTGGKKPYVMVMAQKMREIEKLELSNINDVSAFLFRMINYIDWKTGRLVKDRTKKQLRYKDLIEIMGMGRNRISQILTSLKTLGLLESNSEGYFISNDLYKHGKIKTKETDSNGQ